MTRALVALSALTALFGTFLIVVFATNQTPNSLMHIVACVVLIDHCLVTILYLLANRLAVPLRMVVLVGGVGISLGGLLLLIQNATRVESDPQILASALGAAAVLQGVFTIWQIARTGPSEGS